MIISRLAENKKTTDPEIRKYLIEYLTDRTGKLIEEFNVDNGVSRADIVNISSSELHGYEIKSDVDSLSRLPSQVHSYNKVFSKVTLVVGFDHLMQAIYIIPEWWGVILAKRDGDGDIKFSQIRRASINPSLDIVSLLHLLFKNEISVVMQSRNVKGCTGKTKAGLARNLLDHLDDTEICQAVNTSLLRRYCG